MVEFNDIDDLIKTLINAHLSDGELASYYDGVADNIETKLIEAHLNRCLICYRRYALMREVLTGEDQKNEHKCIDKIALINKINAELKTWVEKHIPVIQLNLGAAFSAPAQNMTIDGKTEDGLCSWRLVKTHSGKWEFHFSSRHTQLLGAAISLRGVPLEKTTNLELFPQKKYIYAELSFSTHETRGIRLEIKLDPLE